MFGHLIYKGQFILLILCCYWETNFEIKTGQEQHQTTQSQWCRQFSSTQCFIMHQCMLFYTEPQVVHVVTNVSSCFSLTRATVTPVNLGDISDASYRHLCQEFRSLSHKMTLICSFSVLFGSIFPGYVSWFSLTIYRLKAQAPVLTDPAFLITFSVGLTYSSTSLIPQILSYRFLSTFAIIRLVAR